MENGNTEVLEQIELIVRDSKPVVTSLQIAEHFDRNHKDVIKSIRDILEEDDPDFNGQNFWLVDYIDEKGESRPMYFLSRDAFIFVVMGYTGKEARRIKKAYIQRFNEMEVFILNQIREGCSEAHITAGQRAGFHPQALCQSCNLSGINAIPAAELPRAMLVAFMGIVRHTFDGKQPQAREA